MWNPQTYKGGQPPDPFSFHVVNVIIHILNSFAVAWILLGLGNGPSLSTLGALIFVSLPLATSAAAYISARSSLISSLFGFLAIGCVLHSLTLLAFPLLALAIISKEDTVILAVPLTVIALMTGTQLWTIFFLVPTVLLFHKRRQLVNLFTHNGNSNMLIYKVESAFPQPVHAITTFTEAVLRFPCWMFGGLQNPDPLIRPVSILSLRFVTALGILLNAVAMAALWEPFRLPLLLMVVSPAAVYAGIPLADQIFEYRFYFSCLGIALFFTALVPLLPVAAVVLGIAGLASMAAFRAAMWNNDPDLWGWAVASGSALKVRPLQNLGCFYKLRNMKALARKYLTVAVQVNPNSGVSLCDLADLEATSGEPEKALKWLEQSIENCPEFPQGWEYMKNLQTHFGNLDRAAECEKELVALGAGG